MGHRGQQETAVPHQTARAGAADAGIVLAHPDHGDRPVFRQDRRGQKARFRDGTLGDAQQQPDSSSEPERAGIENAGDFKIRPRRRKIAGRQQRIIRKTGNGNFHHSTLFPNNFISCFSLYPAPIPKRGRQDRARRRRPPAPPCRPPRRPPARPARDSRRRISPRPAVSLSL